MAEELIEVKNITKQFPGVLANDNVSLDIGKGEIHAIIGENGAGKSTLMNIIYGLYEPTSGEVFFEGKPVKIKSPLDAIGLGIGMVHQHFMLVPYAIKGVHINKKKVKERTNRLIDEFDIRTPSGDLPAGKLSGGNMQKMVIAREFSFDTPILIIAQPTRGVDVGAIEFIHSQIIEKRNKGAAILLVSAELDEIFRLSDRIITLYEGKVTGEFLNGEITKKEIGLYMTGKHMEEVEGGRTVE